MGHKQGHPREGAVAQRRVVTFLPNSPDGWDKNGWLFLGHMVGLFGFRPFSVNTA